MGCVPSTEGSYSSLDAGTSGASEAGCVESGFSDAGVSDETMDVEPPPQEAKSIVEAIKAKIGDFFINVPPRD
jgi:hypothetical protein